MDWFLYDKDLRHERIKKAFKKIGLYEALLIFTDLTAAPNDRVLLNFYSIKGGKST